MRYATNGITRSFVVIWSCYVQNPADFMHQLTLLPSYQELSTSSAPNDMSMMYIEVADDIITPAACHSISTRSTGTNHVAAPCQTWIVPRTAEQSENNPSFLTANAMMDWLDLDGEKYMKMAFKLILWSILLELSRNLGNMESRDSHNQHWRID